VSFFEGHPKCLWADRLNVLSPGPRADFAELPYSKTLSVKASVLNQSTGLDPMKVNQL